nr:uncharacterized protein LOC106732388 isoform X5 [Pelodiscus sinensis]|eukprot:XP_025043257.1 uncharacterized protein LOC106732388 isoform X5 [Pelodiscus sinensis]
MAEWLAGMLLLSQLQVQLSVPWAAVKLRLNCPPAPCWHYWQGNCYCMETSRTGTWTQALRYCKQYRDTELLKISNASEKKWILGLPLNNFWIGLNNLEDLTNFVWSEGTPADITAPWLWMSHPAQPNTAYCVKISSGILIALACSARAHWICKRSADTERYQEHKGKVLLSPPNVPSQVHADLKSAKEACLELRERCTGISTWNNTYALAKGTVLLKSEESSSYAYVKSDCSMGYFGRDCSSVCGLCHNDDLCNPYTGACDDFHLCSAQSMPTSCERDMKSLWCPRFSGWSYWTGNCYYFSTEVPASWLQAREKCRRYRSADLLWIESPEEMDWLFSVISSGTFWIGLNSRQQESIWIWSNEKSAAKELDWLSMIGNPSGRCAGIQSEPRSILKLNCENKYRWLCKKAESPHVFDVFLSRYLSRPFSSQKMYNSLHSAKIDCLYDKNCTGVVKVSHYFRRVAGIDEIHFVPFTAPSNAISYVKRECSLGYYGENCARVCLMCPGKFRCNSITGKCPQKLICVDRFKGEICESGLTSLKCPQDPMWWYWNGNCYYIERKETMQWDQALAQCAFYKHASLLQIESAEEKMWVASVLQGGTWIGLSKQQSGAWQWTSGHGANLAVNWLSDIKRGQSGCAQMKKGGELMATNCSTRLYWVCEKQADLDIFLEYPGRILLSLVAMAQYSTLIEAKFFCMIKAHCTGISSWSSRFYLVSGNEMVSAPQTCIVYLKTSCVSGRYGSGCRKTCPHCTSALPCNSFTGFCDEKTSCLLPFTLASCAATTVSIQCPEVGWRYWKRYCYYISQAKAKPWKDANSTCSRYRGAELVWFESQEELSWIKSSLNEPTWTGLQDINQDGIWAWAYEDNASSVLEWLTFKKRNSWLRCVEITTGELVSAVGCRRAKKWVCKKPAEPDLDLFISIWDAAVILPTPTVSAKYTNHTLAREICVMQRSRCIGYVLWQDSYFLIHDSEFVISGFPQSATYLKSACDFGFYGPSCEKECPGCYWDKPCNSISGKCEDATVCSEPEDVGVCNLGKYSLKCPLGLDWWYWNGQCYFIERSRTLNWIDARFFCSHFKRTSLLRLESSAEKGWLQKKIKQPVWIGMKWETSASEWQWADGSRVNIALNWLNVHRDATANCVFLQHNKVALEAASCLLKYHFVCKRNEDEDMFQFYAEHVITQRQNLVPKVYPSLESAENACLYEKTHCTGVVHSQKRYYLVSGTEVFRSSKKAEALYLKTGCQPGYYGSDCQSVCHPCTNRLPCSGVTGHCVGTAGITCSLQSRDPQCSSSEVSRQLCPQRPHWHYFLKACYYVEDTKTKTWTEARSMCHNFKETDLAKITNSAEKAWIQFKGENSWIGLTYKKEDFRYVWVDGTSTGAEGAWVMKRNRRHTLTKEDCVVAFKHYLSPVDCSSLRKWICKREGAVNLFTIHEGRALYSPYVPISNIYNTLKKARDTCSVLQTCTGVVAMGEHYILQSGMELYNSRNSSVKSFIKSDCISGRFGLQCEFKCPPCQQGMVCNPYTGLCGDTVFCSKESSPIPCEKGAQLKMGGSIGKAAVTISTQQRDKPGCMQETYAGITGTQIFCGCLVLRKRYTGMNGWYLNSPRCHSGRAYMGLDSVEFCSGRTVNSRLQPQDGTVDFQAFQQYYLAGTYTSNSTQQSLWEAFQLCRFQRSICNGVGMIKGEYRTIFATQLLLINGAPGDKSTAYLKSPCAPGYYGPECQGSCTCNRIENCSPFTGECAENLQCSQEYMAQQCQKGVISMKCPEDSGWWYWNGSCYYIEETNSLTWLEAKNYCTAYNGTDLLLLDSAEEKAWVTSVLQKPVWILSLGALQSEVEKSSRKNRRILVSPPKNTALDSCDQLNANGSLNLINCSSLAFWVCERKEGDSMFWKYSRRLLTKPLGRDTYTSLKFAMSACILKADCSGVTYWGKHYIPVTGKELIFSKNRHDAVYLRSACSKGHYGAYCQKKCPNCFNYAVCNKLTGLCDGAVTCQERNKIELCEYHLTSKFCFASWKYWSGNCYYIPPYGVLNKSEAEFMCSRFQGAQLIKLKNVEEQRWIANVITRKSWVGSLSYKLQSNSWIMADGDGAIPRWGFRAVQDLCVQIKPASGTFISFACSERASWICKGAPVPGAQDSIYKWWTTWISSLLVSVFVVVVSVFVTFKAARWRIHVPVEETGGKEQSSKVAMESLASWDDKTFKSQRNNPLN